MATTDSGEWIPEVETFGDRLVVMRRKLGLSQEEAARRAGLSPATWNTWEHDASPRSMPTVVSQISLAFGVNRDWLMWGTNRGVDPSAGAGKPGNDGDSGTLRIDEMSQGGGRHDRRHSRAA